MKKLILKVAMLIAAITYVLVADAQIKGHNNPWFFNQFPGGYPHDSIVDKIKALGPQVLRFPGGTIANKYRTDSTGYGGQTIDKNPNYIYSQVKLAQQTGAKTIYVANLFQPLIHPEDEAFWIQDIVKAVKILNPPYVELGNELQIYPEITGVYAGDPGWFVSKAKFTQTVTASATRYTKLCIKVMAAIRAAGYNPQFGVCMDLPLHTRGKTWNSVLRSWAGYSAEIFHIYSTGRDVVSIQNEINKYIIGSIKPIWITEWAYQLGSDGSNPKNSGDIGKDYYNAFPLNFVTACSYDKRIALMCRHMLGPCENEYCVIKK